MNYKSYASIKEIGYIETPMLRKRFSCIETKTNRFQYNANNKMGIERTCLKERENN